MMLGLAGFGLVIIMMNVKLTCPCSSNQATPPRQSEALLGFQVVLGSRLLLWIVFVLLSVVFVVFCVYISAFMYFAFCLQLTLTVKDSAVFRGLPRSGRKARQEFTLWGVQLYMWWFKLYLSYIVLLHEAKPPDERQDLLCREQACDPAMCNFSLFPAKPFIMNIFLIIIISLYFS